MKFDPTLYVITDSTYHTTETLLHAVEEACRGGATLIQLREKETGGRAYLELAQQVKAVTDRFQIPLIIDDRVDVAIACDAAGVHVGASDLPVAVCRKLLGPDKIVGATAKSVEAAKAAYEDGADYLGTGAIFPTTTHVTTKVTPVSVLNDVCRAVPIPVVAIGGLNADNMDVLSESPIAGVAVVSAVMKAADPAAAGSAYQGKIRQNAYKINANCNKKAPESVIGSFFLYLCGILEFLDRFLSGVGGKQERAVCVIYLDVSVYIFQRAVHVARLPSFSMVSLYRRIREIKRTYCAAVTRSAGGTYAS